MAARAMMPHGWAEYVERADAVRALLDPRLYTMEWLDAQILNGDAKLFVSERGLIIVAVKLYPAGATELHGLCAVGDLDAILDLIEEAESWGRGLGIDFTCISSREGWVRALKGKGYSVIKTELRKDL